MMAFDAFYERERSGLLALALMVCEQPHHADDLVQDVFEAAYRDWDRVTTRENPSFEAILSLLRVISLISVECETFGPPARPRLTPSPERSEVINAISIRREQAFIVD